MLKLKSSIKLIIALSFVIVLGLAFGTTKVEAVELSEEYFESLINELPKEMSVDIPEVEYEKASKILHDKVIAILKDKGFELEGINISILDIGYIYLGKDDFHRFRIHLYNDDGTVRYTSGSIKLTYNNTNNYNSADEESVKNIKLPEPPEYFVFDLDEYENLISQGESSWNAVLKLVSAYYQGYNDDETIKFVASSGLGTFDPLYFEIGELTIGIFKNGVFYDTRRIGNFNAVCRIYIPKEINNTAEDYINYAKPIIEDSFDIENATITKGAKLPNGETEIKNGYTINGYRKIILEEMPTSIVSSEDEKTNVKLETTNDVVPTDTKLVVEEIKTGKEYTTVQNVLKEETTKMVVYDITLLSNNVEIQPNGNVKISLPIPSDYNKENLIVYRVEDNGTKTEYNVKVDGNYATFETDHFSTYVLAEKKVEDTNTDTEIETPTTNNDNKELDETPKTGVETNGTAIAIALVSILSLAGVVTLKRF